MNEVERVPRRWTLEELTALALRRNPEHELACREAETARAAILAAAERPNPTLSLSPGYNASVTEPSPWIVSVALSVPIEAVGRRSPRIEAARRRADAAAKRAEGSAWRIRRAVREAVLLLGEAREIRQLTEEWAAVLARRAELVAKQHRLGEMSATDAAAAIALARQSHLEAVKAAGAESMAGQQLAAVVGVPATTFAGAELAVEALDVRRFPESVADAQHAAVTHRSDLLAALEEYAAARAAVLLASAAQLPSITIGPAYEYDQRENKWSLIASVDLPLLSRGRGALAEAAARCEEAASRVREMQVRIRTEVDAAFVACEDADRQWKAALELEQSSARQLAVAEARRSVGELPLAEVLVARSELLRARLEVARARWRRRAAVGELDDLLQRSEAPGTCVPGTSDGRHQEDSP